MTLLWNSTGCFSCKPSLLKCTHCARAFHHIQPHLHSVTTDLCFYHQRFVSELIQQAANRRHSSLNRNVRWRHNSGETGRKLKLGEKKRYEDERWRWKSIQRVSGIFSGRRRNEIEAETWETWETRTPIFTESSLLGFKSSDCITKFSLSHADGGKVQCLEVLHKWDGQMEQSLNLSANCGKDGYKYTTWAAETKALDLHAPVGSCLEVTFVCLFCLLLCDVLCVFWIGYTVTSVVSARNGRLLVAGAPRFNHTGKVIIFTLKNSGNLTILHSLKGQQVQ